jgi:hypothetical protein
VPTWDSINRWQRKEVVEYADGYVKVYRYEDGRVLYRSGSKWISKDNAMYIIKHMESGGYRERESWELPPEPVETGEEEYITIPNEQYATMWQYSYAVNFYVHGQDRKKGRKVSMSVRVYSDRRDDPSLEERAREAVIDYLANRMHLDHREVFGRRYDPSEWWFDIGEPELTLMADPETGEVGYEGSGWQEVPYDGELMDRGITEVKVDVRKGFSQ